MTNCHLPFSLRLYVMPFVCPVGTLKIAMTFYVIMIIITMTFVMTMHDSFMLEVPPGFRNGKRRLFSNRI